MSTPLGNTINSQVSSTYDTVAGITIVGGFVWDPDGLAWAKMTQPAAAEGGGSGLTDAQLRATDVKVTLDGESVPVTGTFWQVTQPVSLADAPTRDLGKVDIASLDQYTPVSGRLPVDGSGVTQPISAAALPLPSGAAIETGNLAAIKTAVETIDNFISGSKGLVTEDNSAAIKTAVETIDNFISGARGLVTEDNSASIKTAVELTASVGATAAKQDTIIASQATIAALSKAEDAAAVSADTGVPMLAVRQDAPSADQSTNGDYAWLRVDAYGQLRVVNQDSLASQALSAMYLEQSVQLQYARSQTCGGAGFVPAPQLSIGA